MNRRGFFGVVGGALSALGIVKAASANKPEELYPRKNPICPEGCGPPATSGYISTNVDDCWIDLQEREVATFVNMTWADLKPGEFAAVTATEPTWAVRAYYIDSERPAPPLTVVAMEPIKRGRVGKFLLRGSCKE